MTASDLPYALHGLLLVGVFLAWFFLCWQRYAIEKGRDDVLELRDSWFDLIAFDHQWHGHAACRAFLAVLEAQARSIHRCSSPLMALLLCVPQVRERTSARSISALIRALPDEQLRVHARRLQDEVALAIGCSMLRRSPAMVILVLALLPVVLAVALVLRALGSLSVTSSVAFRRLCSLPMRVLRSVSEVELNLSAR
jgi:pimeloyl-ACP methyl ester carboxylesterase